MKQSIRESIGKHLVEIGEKKELYVVDCDMAKHTKLNYYFERFPNRSYQMGISEQNAMSLAAGLSSIHNPVVLSSFAIFIVGRAWEQIRHSIAYNHCNVKIIGTHAGLSAAQDGATHQCIEDIALTCAIPNMIVLSPLDSYEGKQMINYAINNYGPYYIRVGRDECDEIFDETYEFILGEPVLLSGNPNDKTVVITTGEIGHEVLKAEKLLKEKGISIKIIHIPSLKPLNDKSLIQLIGKSTNILIVEEHSSYGGLNSIISNAILGKVIIKKYINMSLSSFGETGTYDELKEKYKLNYRYIIKEIIKFEDN